jgi:hypothetical protein
MYYEEKLINGILHWRGDPDDEFKPYTLGELSGRYKMLEKENGARRILTKTLADFTLAHSGLLYVWLCVQAVFDPAFDFHAEFQGITGQCRKEVR